MPRNKLGLPARREDEVGEMQLENATKGRGKLWGVTAFPYPWVPVIQLLSAGLAGKAAKLDGHSRDVIPP